MTRPPFWATVWAIVGIAILCTLGTWQLQRLEWKNGLIAAIDTAKVATPADMSAEQIIQTAPTATAPRDDFFQRVRITGRYLHNHEIILKPRPNPENPNSQKTGFYLVTLFLLDDNTTTLPVLRGWVADIDDQFIQRPDAPVTIIGTLRAPTATNPFTPKNNPETGMWFTINHADLAAASGLDTIAPVVLYEETRRADVGWPIPVPATPNMNNNHLQYAIFWFMMAGVLAVMYVLRFIVYGAKGSAV